MSEQPQPTGLTMAKIEVKMIEQIEVHAKARAVELYELTLKEQWKGKPLVAKPETFDGEKLKYNDWLQEMKTYLQYVEGGCNKTN